MEHGLLPETICTPLYHVFSRGLNNCQHDGSEFVVELHTLQDAFVSFFFGSNRATWRLLRRGRDIQDPKPSTLPEGTHEGPSERLHRDFPERVVFFFFLSGGLSNPGTRLQGLVTAPNF